MSDAQAISGFFRRKPSKAAPPTLFMLRSDSDMPCGVETFARRLAEAAGGRAQAPVLKRGAAATLRRPGALVINLPVVAWKQNVAGPIWTAVAARLQGLSVVVVLHEWNDLCRKRRATYAPLLLLARSLLFSCPAVKRQFDLSWSSLLATKRRGDVPVPPNVTHPGITARSPHSERLAAERRAGRLVVGCFGAIYPKKQPLAVLEVVAELKRRGHDPFIVFAGSFIRAADSIERDFDARVTALGLNDDVLVTGYIRCEAELFGVFEQVDVFLYRFYDGLTSRRASVFASLLSGKPVVVNAPRRPEEFGRFAGGKALLGGKGLCLAATDADVDGLADAVIAARERTFDAVVDVDVKSFWAEALATIEAAAAPERSLNIFPA